MYSFGVVLWELVTREMRRRGSLRDVHVPRECPQAHLGVYLCLDPVS